MSLAFLPFRIHLQTVSRQEIDILGERNEMLSKEAVVVVRRLDEEQGGAHSGDQTAHGGWQLLDVRGVGWAGGRRGGRRCARSDWASRLAGRRRALVGGGARAAGRGGERA